MVGLFLFLGRYQQMASFSSLFGYYDEVVLGRYLLMLFTVLAVLGLIPAFIASRKGRNFFDWWFFGAALFPIALIWSFFLKPRVSELPRGSDPLQATEQEISR
jgi:hypothetical protein